MRAIVCDGFGGPEVMRLAEVPDPVPAAGEVLVRVVATSVNRADTLQRRGFYPPPAGESEILGLEACGEVVAAGDGVDAFRTGDMVCALLGGGGYAEMVAVPAGQCMPLPPGVDPVDAGGLTEVFLTAHDNLVTRLRVAPGETLLVHGGAGGVGTAAIQVARRVGARVLVTARSAERLAVCAGLGADAGINHLTEDFVARARALTGGRGVDAILDVMGASHLERNLEALADDGRLCVIGLQGGVQADVDLNMMLRRRLSLVATTLRSRPSVQKAEVVRRFADDMLDGFADGTLRVVVHEVVPLADAARAHRLVEEGSVVGKVVLRV